MNSEGNITENTPLTEKITNPALQRLLRRAGVKRISTPVFDTLRHIIEKFSTSIMKNVIIFVQASKRKTIQVEDLAPALSLLNINLAAGLNSNSKKVGSLQSCNSVGKSGPTKKSKEGESKKHRFKPGTKAIRSIRYHQKNSDFLSIPKANFDRLIRSITSLIIEEIRFSEGVVDLIQLVVEDHIINICKKAYECTLFSNRDTIHSRDVELVLKIMDFDYD